MPIEVNGQLETDDVLVQAGIDPEAMGYLTGKERREILIKAGLNPKEFDFQATGRGGIRGMHIEYDDFGSYEETDDLEPVALPQCRPAGDQDMTTMM